MIKIGITGSLASGKTTASKILSSAKGSLFSADKAVKEIYRSKIFRKLISKKFNIINNNQIKKSIKKLILDNTSNIKKLEKIIHPLVRKKMKEFTLQNKNNKILFYEIPLLIENKLMKYFDVIIFIKTSKKIRIQRFKSKKGDSKLFHLFNNKQMIDSRKMKFSDHVVVNEKNLKILKKNLFAIMSVYE